MLHSVFLLFLLAIDDDSVEKNITLQKKFVEDFQGACICESVDPKIKKIEHCKQITRNEMRQIMGKILEERGCKPSNYSNVFYLIPGLAAFIAVFWYKKRKGF